jgi:hypothetical protein
MYIPENTDVLEPYFSDLAIIWAGVMTTWSQSKRKEEIPSKVGFEADARSVKIVKLLQPFFL